MDKLRVKETALDEAENILDLESINERAEEVMADVAGRVDDRIRDVEEVVDSWVSDQNRVVRWLISGLESLIGKVIGRIVCQRADCPKCE